MEYYTTIRKNKVLIYTTVLNLENIMLSEISQSKKTTGYEYIYMKYSGCANLWRQKVDCLPRLGGVRDRVKLRIGNDC